MKKSIKIVNLATITLPLFPVSFSFCGCSNSVDDKVLTCDYHGIDWPGAKPLSFFSDDDMDIDDQTKTITYKSSSHFVVEESLTIPEYVVKDGTQYKVVIGNRCFLNNQKIAGNIIFNQFTQTVSDWAFSNTNISKITFKEYPTSIGNSSFANCAFLKEIDVVKNGYIDNIWTKNLTKIGNAAFKGCTSLSSEIIFGSEFSSIGVEAFYECTHIRCVSFSHADKLTTIPDGAFAKCINIETLDFGPKFSKIGNASFSDCSSLEIINLPVENMVLELDEYSFSQCSSLKRFSKKCYFKNLPPFCFNNCHSIEISPWLDAIDGQTPPTIGVGAFQATGYRRIKFYKNMTQPSELAFANLIETSTEILIIDLTDFDARDPAQILNWTEKPSSPQRAMFYGKPLMGRIRFKKTSSQEVDHGWDDVFEIMGFSKGDYGPDKWWVEFE